MIDLPIAASDEWYTPAPLVDLVRRVLGGIDIDPASNNVAQPVVGARTFYTVETNGLGHEWPGRVFLNPPYSDPAPFINKLLAERDAERTTEAIALVNARTSSMWWAALASKASARCDVRGRVKFWRPERPEGSAGRMGSVFFYLGPNVSRFVDVFRSQGTVTLSRNASCGSCGARVAASRSDAAYCSSACRQRAYRARQTPRRAAFGGRGTPGEGGTGKEPSEAPGSPSGASDHHTGQSRNVA